jgi:hypothetical protein
MIDQKTVSGIRGIRSTNSFNKYVALIGDEDK